MNRRARPWSKSRRVTKSEGMSMKSRQENTSRSTSEEKRDRHQPKKRRGRSPEMDRQGVAIRWHNLNLHNSWNKWEVIGVGELFFDGFPFLC